VPRNIINTSSLTAKRILKRRYRLNLENMGKKDNDQDIMSGRGGACPTSDLSLFLSCLPFVPTSSASSQRIVGNPEGQHVPENTLLANEW
jgi:hypothetical protein